MTTEASMARVAAAHGVTVEDWKRISDRIQENREREAGIRSAMRAPERGLLAA